MKIVIDGCAFERTWQRGIQRYFYELLSRAPSEVVGTMFFRKLPVAPVPCALKIIEVAEEYHLDRGNIGGRVIAKARRLWFPTAYPKGDVFHSSYFTRCPHKGIPEVLTVHDMVPEVMPYYFDSDVTQEIAKKRECILAAERIIAISHSTASDLAEVYPEVSDRIEVVHSGAGHFSVVDEAEILSRVCSDDPYAVFVGDRRGYKNFASVLDAMTTREWPKELKLMVIGSQFSEAELLTIRYRGLESTVRLAVYPTDAEMRDLMCKAAVFIFPSLMEGFGFPIVEAQAFGVPVVASDTRIFREVGGDAFLRVSPLDPSSIATGVRQTLEPEVRISLSLSGIKNVRRFSWDRCAEQTCEVWRQVAASGSTR